MLVMIMMSVPVHTSVHASMHAQKFMTCLGPYLSKIVSDQRNKDIYGIRRASQTCLSP